jgi:hypothetical protein
VLSEALVGQDPGLCCSQLEVSTHGGYLADQNNDSWRQPVDCCNMLADCPLHHCQAGITITVPRNAWPKLMLAVLQLSHRVGINPAHWVYGISTWKVRHNSDVQRTVSSPGGLLCFVGK